MLKPLKYCLLLVTFVSATAQQTNEMTSSIEQVNLVGEDLDRETDLHENQIQAIDHTKGKLLELCKELAIDAAQFKLLEFFLSPIYTITHELGHAVAAKSLFDVHKPIQIHIGTTTPEKKPLLFSLGNMHFYKSIPLKGGKTELREMYPKQNRKAYENMDKGIMLAAGGLSAATTMYVLLSAITGYCAYCDNKGLSEITLKSLINGASPFSYILNTKNLSIKQKRFLLNATLIICFYLIFNIFYGCTPYYPVKNAQATGDGEIIWEKNIGVNGTSLRVAQILSILGVWGCRILLIKKYCDARKKLSPNDSKIAMPAAVISFLLTHKICIPKI